MMAYAQGCLLKKDSSDFEVELFFDFNPSFDQNLGAGFIAQTEADLQKFARETSNQIAVVTTDDLCGYTPNEFSTKFLEHLGIGQAGLDNGVVLLIYFNADKKEKEIYIAVGKGLNGAIPDITAKKIYREQILPFFKRGDFTAGISSGIASLKQAAKGEYNEAVQISEDLTPLFIFLFILLLFFYLSYRSKQRYGGRTISRRGVFDYDDYFPHSGRGGGFFGSGGSSFGSGSSGGGFSGGEGFGGFGGGSSFGGGAGGSW